MSNYEVELLGYKWLTLSQNEICSFYYEDSYLTFLFQYINKIIVCHRLSNIVLDFDSAFRIKTKQSKIYFCKYISIDGVNLPS